MAINYNRNTTGEGNTDIELAKIQNALAKAQSGASVSTGSGAPTSTPVRVGDIYVNTDTGAMYMAMDTDGSWNWAYIGQGSTSSFTKDTIAGLTSWYKADDGPSPTTEATNITSWVDKSTTGNTLTAVSGTRAYTSNVKNGLPGIRFVANSYISGTDLGNRSAPFTIFCVVLPTNIDAGTYQDFFSLGASYDTKIGKNTGTINSRATAGTDLVNGAVSNNTAQLFTFVANGASSSLEINNNGATSGNAGSTAHENRPIIGAAWNGTQGFTGYFLELLVYDGALSTANIDIVKAYINNKWAIY